MINEYFQGCVFEQTKYVELMEKLASDCELNIFRAALHRLALITQTRTELLAGVNTLSNLSKENFQATDSKIINELIKHMKGNFNLFINVRTYMKKI